MPELPPAFELREASTHYGDHEALHGVSLRAEQGRVTAIVGVNGAGKSTTLMLIAGLMPLRGDAWFMGEQCAAAARRVIRDGVALSPEGRRVFAEMSVEDNLLVGAFRVRDRDLPGRLERVYATFPRLRERRDQHAGTLSGGEQQMLAIGRALMSDPRLLLLDEPTLGLAPKVTATVVSLIREIAASGISIVLVEQNAQAALSLASYIYVLDAGRIARHGPAQEFRDPRALRDTMLAGAGVSQ